MDDDVLDVTGWDKARGIADEVERRRGGHLHAEAADDQNRFFYSRKEESLNKLGRRLLILGAINETNRLHTCMPFSKHQVQQPGRHADGLQATAAVDGLEQAQSRSARGDEILKEGGEQDGPDLDDPDTDHAQEDGNSQEHAQMQHAFQGEVWADRGVGDGILDSGRRRTAQRETARRHCSTRPGRAKICTKVRGRDGEDCGGGENENDRRKLD